MGTLNSQEVPLTTNRFCFTVVAYNVNHTLQIGRHGVFRNVPRTGFPSRRHALLAHYSLFANRTAVVESGKFAKAMGMNGVAAGKILRGLARGEHVFSAHGTIVLIFVLEAMVRFKDTDRDAHAALGAVTKGFLTSHTTKSTLAAVKGFLCLS